MTKERYEEIFEYVKTLIKEHINFDKFESGAPFETLKDVNEFLYKELKKITKNDYELYIAGTFVSFIIGEIVRRLATVEVLGEVGEIMKINALFHGGKAKN